MKHIILDTNFLLIPAQFKVDIFSEIDRICNFNYKLFIFDKTLKELDDIIKTQKDKTAARIALQLIKNKNVEVIKSDDKNKDVDELILSLDSKGFIIATQDKMLQKQIRLKNISFIFLRQKKYLVLSSKV